MDGLWLLAVVHRIIHSSVGPPRHVSDFPYLYNYYYNKRRKTKSVEYHDIKSISLDEAPQTNALATATTRRIKSKHVTCNL